VTAPPTIAANFDRVARPYRWMEYLTFGRSLERCRLHFLPLLHTRRHALVLGDGDGRFLARLLSANPHLEADAVDLSPSMLRLLENRAQTVAPDATARLRIFQADALAFTPEQPCDLIVTHFFLDCLTRSQTEALALRLAQYALPGALWLVSDFRIPAGAMRWPARALVWSLYLAFRMLTGLRTTRLPDHAAALTEAGFHRIERNLSLAGMLTSELWEYTPAMLPPQKPTPKSNVQPDPIPDPEPASPSLPEPDPGVFHPEAEQPPGSPPKPGATCR
jgi:ubiquinone/menaquinone biosynthesis C-methylase UbiE